MSFQQDIESGRATFTRNSQKVISVAGVLVVVPPHVAVISDSQGIHMGGPTLEVDRIIEKTDKVWRVE